jgi:flagellar motor switch protein FliM
MEDLGHSNTGGGAILRRKVTQAAPVRVDDGRLLLEQALKLGMGKAARATQDLPLRVTELALSTVSLTELIDLTEPGMFIALLEGTGEALGLVLLDAGALAAFVEIQTTCRVSQGVAPPRKPTCTDAALMAGIIDRFLQEFEVGLAESADLAWAGGYRFASFLDDARPLGLLLDDTKYRLACASVDLAQGAKQGQWFLALPAELPKAKGGAKVPQVKQTPLCDTPQHWHSAMARLVTLCPAQLDAVLHRTKLPLHSIMELKVGSVLQIPLSVLEQITLETLDRRTVAIGRLGQSRGSRAIRLTEEPSTDCAVNPMPTRVFEPAVTRDLDDPG